MADITMCNGHNCPFKEKCYRYRAIPDSHWQSYMDAPYEDGYCEFFIDLGTRNKSVSYDGDND